MPVTIHTGYLNVRDDNGEYIRYNTVAEETVQEMVEDIEAKGAEVIDSIPDDYTALTNQVDDLESDLDAVDLSPLWANGYYTTSGTYIGAFTASEAYKSCVINVLSGDKIKLTGIGASGARLWAFANADNVITRRADVNAYGDDLELTVADGEVYFVYNADNGSNLHIPSLKYTSRTKTLENSRKHFADLKAHVYQYKCDGLFHNGFYNTAGTYIGSFTSNSGYRSCIMHVLVGEKINISGIGAVNGRLWAFAKADGEITRRADASGYLDGGTLTVESGEALFVFNAAASSNTHPLSLAIEVDREKSLESLRADTASIDARVTDIETRQLVSKSIRNNLVTDGVSNLLGVKCYNNDAASAANYGLDGTKYVIDIGNFSKCHVFFRYRHNSYADYSDTDILVPLASVGTNNALNVQELYRNIDAQTGRLYQKQFAYPANISAANSELLNPLFYKPKQGESALRIFYTGEVSSTSAVSAAIADGAITFSVDGSTVGTVTLTGTDTVQELADDINALTGFVCEVVNSDGTVAELLLPASMTISMINTATRDGSTVYGTLYIDIPYKVDKSWHTCEFVVDKIEQTAYVAFDGLTKKITFTSSRALADGVIVIGGSYTANADLTVRDLELDINTYGACEVVTGHNNDASTGNTSQLISYHNPRLMIFEGHGIMVGSESEAQEAYTDSRSSTSQEAMQASTDRLNIVLWELASRGYKPVTMEQVINWKKGLIDLPKRCYLCIFDDNRLVNYLDYDKRRPFVKYGVKATLAQISDLLTPEGTVSANGITYMEKDAVNMINVAGWYICSHTSDHRKLSDYTVSENVTKLKADVLSCNANMLHSDVLVYPYGGINAGALNAMKASDFALGISIVEDRYNCRALSDYRLVRTELGTRASLASVLAPFI